MSKLKLFIGLLVSVVIFVSSFGNALALTVAKPTPTPAPVAEVNSFDAFWPLAAGKTADESLYFLKTLKEKVRGLFIFGTPQKLDYSVLLATKRVLEAEKLVKESKFDVAKTTLDSAMSELNKADADIQSAKNSGQSLGEVSQQISDRLTNIGKLTKWLATTNSQVKDALLLVSDKAASLSSKL
jgi:hypothetical protein